MAFDEDDAIPSLRLVTGTRTSLMGALELPPLRPLDAPIGGKFEAPDFTESTPFGARGGRGLGDFRMPSLNAFVTVRVNIRLT